MKKPVTQTRPSGPKEQIEGPFSDEGLLPARVAAMREKILAACKSGDIEKLRPAIERNEVLPLFGRRGDRPKSFAVAVEFLRSASFDKKGRETLDLLDAVFSTPFAKVTRGAHVLFVWPAFAILPQTRMDEEARLAQLRCTAFADLKQASALPPPLHRGEIGEDGTWHAFGVS